MSWSNRSAHRCAPVSVLISWALRSDKAVAATGYRLNAAALSPIPIENAAQRRDLHGQVAFLDRRAQPDSLHDLVFRDQLPLLLDEQGEHIERTRPERDRFGDTGPLQPRQIAAGAIETKSFELQNVSRIEPLHIVVPFASGDLQVALHPSAALRCG
jgi:hypothetical protein